MDAATPKTLILTARIITAYVRGNRIPIGELPGLVGRINQLLEALHQGEEVVEPDSALHPAVPIDQSVTPDYIVSLEDGRRFRSLTRHLKTRYGLTPAQYRARWNLPPHYPMVAPNYSRVRARIGRIAREKQLKERK